MIELIPIDKLLLLDRNPRKITDVQFKKLMKSLEEDADFLQARPILVNYRTCDKTYTVYAGNQRVRAAEKLGWEKVPCVVERNLSKAKMDSRVIKDNIGFGENDWDILSSDFDVSNLLDWGYTPTMLGLDLTAPSDDIPDKKEKKKKQCPECGHEF